MQAITGSIGQWLGIVFLGVGIGVEISLHADYGYLLITIGSAVFAIATKYKYYNKQHRKRK